MLLSQKLSYEKNSFERIELFLSNQVFCYIFNVAINSVVCFPMLWKESLRSPTERLYFLIVWPEFWSLASKCIYEREVPPSEPKSILTPIYFLSSLLGEEWMLVIIETQRGFDEDD